MLKRAKSIKEESQLICINDNTAASLRAYMAAMVTSGKDKLTLVISEKVKKFGLWLEQLVAESSGKDGFASLYMPSGSNCWADPTPSK